MRRLVQRHLRPEDCLALLRTSHHFARTAARQRPLTLRWHAHDAQRLQLVVALLEAWAPPDLTLELHGQRPTGTPPAGRTPLPPAAAAALLPLATRLRFAGMHLGPDDLDHMQRHCQRLQALHLEGCSHGGAGEEPPTSGPTGGGLRPLPQLRELRLDSHHAPGALVAMAANVDELDVALASGAQAGGAERLLAALPRLSRVRVRLGANAGGGEAWARALLRHPAVEHVTLDGQGGVGGARAGEAVRWRSLTLQGGAGLEVLARLPALEGLGRVAVVGEVRLGARERAAEVRRVVRELGGRLAVQPERGGRCASASASSCRVREGWRWLGDSEEEEEAEEAAQEKAEEDVGWVTLVVDRTGWAPAHREVVAELLGRLDNGAANLPCVLAVVGAPEVWCVLRDVVGALVARTPAGAVGALWADFSRADEEEEAGRLDGVLCRLPACVRRVVVERATARMMLELCSDAPAHGLEVTWLRGGGWGDGDGQEAEEEEAEGQYGWDVRAERMRELRNACQAHEPPISLRVVER